MTTATHAGFRDPTALTKWTKGFLYASLPLVLLAVVGSGRDYWWFSNHGQPAPGIMLPVESIGGLIVALTVLPMAVVGLGTDVLVLMWIHRANHNARRLGATNMNFTPGWARGWYFIPIAWFWKPYQAMKEVWKASFNPARWWEDDVSWLLPVWWALWLMTFFGGGSLSWTASTDVAQSASEFLRELLRIPLTLVLIGIISQIHRMQMANYRTQGAEVTDDE